MKVYIAAVLTCLAVGCSDQSAQQDMTDDTFDAEPAGYTVHPAEETGYIDSVDPEAYPPSAGDTSSGAGARW